MEGYPAFALLADSDTNKKSSESQNDKMLCLKPSLVLEFPGWVRGQKLILLRVEPDLTPYQGLVLQRTMSTNHGSHNFVKMVPQHNATDIEPIPHAERKYYQCLSVNK